MIARTHDLLKSDEENTTTRRDTEAGLGPVLANTAEHEVEVQRLLEVQREALAVRPGDEDPVRQSRFGRRWRGGIILEATSERCRQHQNPD